MNYDGEEHLGFLATVISAYGYLADYATDMYNYVDYGEIEHQAKVKSEIEGLMMQPAIDEASRVGAETQRTIAMKKKMDQQKIIMGVSIVGGLLLAVGFVKLQK